MKKIVTIMFILTLAILLIACDKYYKYERLDDYLVQVVFLENNEEYKFDIKKEFSNYEINITKYEIYSSDLSDEDIVGIKRNTITGKASGYTNINVRLYERETNTVYSVILAEVVVYNIDEMTEIKTAEDLQNIDILGRYILKSDIDLKNYGNWDPIGGIAYEESFQGIFINPEGYKISNLTINNTNGSAEVPYGGLFKRVRNAYIDGIILENTYIDLGNYYGDGSATAGGIAFAIDDSYIRNCSVEGVIIGQFRAGGITGNNDKSFILDSKFKGTVKTAVAFHNEVGAGGIVGYNYTADTMGGIRNCSVEAEVTSLNAAGGIIGVNLFNHLPKNSFFNGTVKGDVYQGEIIGRAIYPYK